jgi:hypothetical protein
MPVEIIDASGKVLQARVWAVLRKVDYDLMVPPAKESIAREGKIRVLIFLEAFGGWEWRADWGDVTFITEHSKDFGRSQSWEMRSGRTTLLLLPPKGFVPPPSSSLLRYAWRKHEPG